MPAITATPEASTRPQPGASPGAFSPSDLAKLKQAARDFESILLRDVLKTMRESSTQGKGLLSGTSQRLYQDMMDDEMAKAMARQGGLGLADMLVRSLTRLGAPAKKSSSSAPAGPMNPTSTTPAEEEPSR